MTDPPSPVILVHGAWHGPWCWERVEALLCERGIETLAIDLPTMNVNAGYVTDVHSDAAALRDALDAIDRPAVVVGHSYGGMVISEGAAEHPNARHLLYLTAFMPDAGESLGTLLGGGPPNDELLAALRLADDKRSTLDPSAVGPLFYNDCDEATVTWATERLRPMLSETNEPVRAAAWRGIPSTYVICSDDRAILPALQRRMSARAGDLIEWATSHSPFASRPDLVGDLLERLARA